MANDTFTIADFVADALDVDETAASNVLNDAPYISMLPFTDTADGSATHKYSVHTGDPAVGFRLENAGRDYDHSTDTVTQVDCKILDFSWRVDKAVADTWRDGPEALISREGMRHLQAAMFILEQQTLIGTGFGANGFNGHLDNSELDELSDEMVVNGGGAAVGAQGSVYAVRFGFDDARLVSPGEIMLGETVVSEAAGAEGANYPVYYTPATLFVGYQMGGRYSIGRIANLNSEGEAAGLDDDKLSELLSVFPAGRGPDAFVMNRTRERELQQSRTATNISGAPAPFPEEAFGVPIIVTDALKQDEAVVA